MTLPTLDQRLRNAFKNLLVKRVGELLEQGANILGLDEQGNGVAHAVAQASSREILLFEALFDVLSKHKVPLDEPNLEGFSPLGVAAFHETSPVVKWLVANGADVKRPGPDGLQILGRMAESGEFETLRVLVESGADLNALDPAGFSPIHRIAYSVHAMADHGTVRLLKSMDVLIEHGAILTLRTNPVGTGFISKAEVPSTPVELALRRNSPPLGRRLMEAGALSNVGRAPMNRLIDACVAKQAWNFLDAVLEHNHHVLPRRQLEQLLVAVEPGSSAHQTVERMLLANTAKAVPGSKAIPPVKVRARL